MKKLVLVNVLAGVGVLSSCAAVVDTAVAVAPKVSSPFIETLGVQPAGWLTIINTTPFMLEVIVYGKTVVYLKPGESVVDTRRWEPLISEGVEVPILVRAYDASGNYIGVAGRIFYRRSNNWNITQKDIIKGPYSFDHSSLPPSLNSYFVKFPREMFNGTTVLQVANNTSQKILLRVNGVPQVILNPTEIFYQKFTDFSHFHWHSEQIQISVVAVSNPTKYNWSRSIWTHSRGIHAYQWIINNL